LTSVDGLLTFSDEQSAGLILSEIYDGDTDALLGEAQLSILGSGYLRGTDGVEFATEFARIKTQSLIVDDASFGFFFNDFETSAVPEPGTGSVLILFGAIAATRRRRPAVSN
jgi:hypothetical protein